jgi:uncharacterized protein YndB with AHSA1/START domain
MSDQGFTTTFSVDKSPEAVFDAVNQVREWWGEEVGGSNDKAGDEFTFRVKDIHYSKIKVVELVPNQRIVWYVLDNRLNFVGDQSEWVGTTITFDIAAGDGQTDVHFTHAGLVPAYECFDVCSNAWSTLMHGSLRRFITTGKGDPYRMESH